MRDAEIYYRKVLNKLPENMQSEALRISLAQVLMNVGQPCMALELYLEILKDNPDRIDVQKLKNNADLKCNEKKGQSVIS